MFLFQSGRISLLLLAVSINAYADLPKAINDQLSKYAIEPSALSVIVEPVKPGQALLAHLETKPRNPASVIKLLTTASALDQLGPAYTWKTQYFLQGKLENGVLDGDLVIKGGGDPALVKERFWLQLAALREQGLKDIKGRLLIDNSAFDLPQHDNSSFDQQPSRLYNVGPSATLANFNASRFRIEPHATGITISQDPPLHNVVVNNYLKLAQGKCRGVQGGWSFDVDHRQGVAVVTFTGSYRNQCGRYDLHRSVLDSDDYLYGLFLYLWRSLGGQMNGGLGQTVLQSTAPPFYVGESKTLAQVINGINKYSNNLLARQLLLSLGISDSGQGATPKDGIRAINSWLVTQGLPMTELVLENGAGLSRNTQISAQHLNQLLVQAASAVYAPEFMASFPLTGIDGTMKSRLLKQVLGGRARLKTGYIKGVRSLAGYIRADSRTDYAVVLLIQSPKVNFSNGNQIQDALIRWVLETG